MTRALDALAAAAWWALFGFMVLWWTPVIALRLGQLAAGRLRFRAVVAWADMLKAVGRTDGARQVYRHEMERCRVRAEAIRARRGW